MYTYNAIITNVVDGDTFDVDVDLGFHIHNHIRIRLLDIDTPEKRGSAEKELGLLCTDFARKYFFNREIIIESKGEEPDTDSFGRWLCTLKFKNELFLGYTANFFHHYDKGADIRDIYNALGINKKHPSYCQTAVKNLKEYL